jgi:hypothetical protein
MGDDDPRLRWRDFMAFRRRNQASAFAPSPNFEIDKIQGPPRAVFCLTIQRSYEAEREAAETQHATLSQRAKLPAVPEMYGNRPPAAHLMCSA